MVAASPSWAQDGLVSHFTFDNTLVNEIGDVPAGELMGGASFVPGALGQAVQLDGVDDWIDTTTAGQPAAVTLLETTVAFWICLLYTSPSPRDKRQSRMPSSA